MFIAIVQHTPVGIWALLAALVVIGLLQTRGRQVSPTRATMLPLVMTVMSLSGVLLGFGPTPMALGGWVVGLLAAVACGRRFVAVRGGFRVPQTGELRLPGSWLPLALILGLFAAKYVAGAGLAMHPGLAANATFAGTLCLIFGGFSGLFLARGLSLRTLATGSFAALPA